MANDTNKPMAPANKKIGNRKINLSDEETLRLEKLCREGDEKACEEVERHS